MKRTEEALDGFMSDPAILDLQNELAALKAAVDAFVLDHEAYEDDTYKLTRVQGHRRTWNADKLEAILPRGLFKRVIKITVDPAKLDQLVRAKKIDGKKIDPAFEETPNAPYVKYTVKSEDSGASEAEGLAEALA